MERANIVMVKMSVLRAMVLCKSIRPLASIYRLWEPSRWRRERDVATATCATMPKWNAVKYTDGGTESIHDKQKEWISEGFECALRKVTRLGKADFV